MLSCTKKNPPPPCTDGYYETENKKGDICCYKKSKTKLDIIDDNKNIEIENINASNIDINGKKRKSKNLKSGKCIFPFRHSRKLHTKCIQTKDGNQWCATSIAPDKKMLSWAYCNLAKNNDSKNKEAVDIENKKNNNIKNKEAVKIENIKNNDIKNKEAVKIENIKNNDIKNKEAVNIENKKNIVDLDTPEVPFNEYKLKLSIQNLFNKFYTYHNELIHYLINFKSHKFGPDTKMDINISIFNNTENYHYNELDIEQNNNRYEDNIRIELLKKPIDINDKKNITRIIHDYARGVKIYINSKLERTNFVTNAVTKLWEIYNNFANILPYEGTLNAFHMAEAPGQWIICTQNYIKQKRKKLNYNWIANTLKGNSNTNIDPLEDEFGLIKNNPDKWLFGADNTGDITKSINILSFREELQKKFKGKINLVTGDAGTKNVPLNIYQKIDYSQMATVIATCGINGNCIIKHFLPYIYEFPDSFEASGFFMNYIYCYYLLFKHVILYKPKTSNPSSTEFYLIGISYKGCSEIIMNKIIEQCDNFKDNQCIFNKQDIPTVFSYQVIDFINSMYKVVNEYIQTQNILYLSFIDPELNKYNYILSLDFKKRVLNKRYNQWLYKNKFNPEQYKNNTGKFTNHKSKKNHTFKHKNRTLKHKLAKLR